MPQFKAYSADPSNTYVAEYPSVNVSPTTTKLKSPAVGLIGTGIILALVCLWSLSFLLLAKDKRNANDMRDEVLALSIMSSLATAVMAGLIIYGATRMMNAASIGWSRTAAVLSICTIIPGLWGFAGIPALFLGVPIGIWALIVLNKPDVKAAFR